MKLVASTLRASFSYPTSQLADRCDRLRHSLHTDAPLADLHTTTPRPVLLEHVLDENATAWSQQQLTRPTGDACSAEASRPPYAAPPRTHAPSTARPDGIAPQRQELQPSKYNIYEHARTHTHTHTGQIGPPPRAWNAAPTSRSAGLFLPCFLPNTPRLAPRVVAGCAAWPMMRRISGDSGGASHPRHLQSLPAESPARDSRRCDSSP